MGRIYAREHVPRTRLSRQSVPWQRANEDTGRKSTWLILLKSVPTGWIEPLAQSASPENRPRPGRPVAGAARCRESLTLIEIQVLLRNGLGWHRLPDGRDRRRESQGDRRSVLRCPGAGARASWSSRRTATRTLPTPRDHASLPERHTGHTSLARHPGHQRRGRRGAQTGRTHPGRWAAKAIGQLRRCRPGTPAPQQATLARSPLPDHPKRRIARPPRGLQNVLAFVEPDLTDAFAGDTNRIVTLVRSRTSGCRNPDTFTNSIRLVRADFAIPAHLPSNLRTL